MSGLEVPGLIIGAIGVLAPALSSCMKLYDQVQEYRQFDKILRIFSRNFSIQRRQTRHYTKMLFQGATEDAHLEALLRDPNHPQWYDQQWNEEMRKHLGDDDFNICIEIFGSVREILEEISRIAQSDNPQSQNTSSSYSWHDRFAIYKRKVKFGFRSQKQMLKDLLDDLRHLNTELCRLVDRKHELRLLPLTPKNGPIAVNLEELRLAQEASKDMLEVLSTVKCKCHTASLRLRFSERNKNPTQSACQKSASHSCGLSLFHFVLSPSTSLMQPDPDYNSVFVQSATHCCGLAPKPASVNSTNAQGSLGQISSTSKYYCKMLPEKEDIPLSLSNGGYLHLLRRERYNPGPEAGTHCTLKTIVSGQGEGIHLSMQDRYEIAAILARSVLQLHTSPWLQQNWRSPDILFFAVSHPDLCSGSPYLSISFPPEISDEGNVNTGWNEPVPCFGAQLPSLGNPQIYGLGLILLELGVGKSLEQSTHGQGSLVMSLREKEKMMAQDLITDLGRHMGAEYNNIVRTCLACDFKVDNGDFRLDQEKMQVEYYMKVVDHLDAIAKKFGGWGL